MFVSLSISLALSVSARGPGLCQSPCKSLLIHLFLLWAWASSTHSQSHSPTHHLFHSQVNLNTSHYSQFEKQLVAHVSCWDVYICGRDLWRSGRGGRGLEVQALFAVLLRVNFVGSYLLFDIVSFPRFYLSCLKYVQCICYV